MNVVRSWTYRTADGAPIGRVDRLEHPRSSSKSGKQVIPYFHADGRAGIPDDLPASHRLFGLETIQDRHKPIFIVEGEKCAAAIHGLGFQCVTSLGGSSQAKHADWSALAHAETIYLLPDNDDSGLNYMRDIYDALKKTSLQANIRILFLEVPAKGDVCDFLKKLRALADWNELDSLSAHPERRSAMDSLAEQIKQNAAPVPTEWRFAVTKHQYKLISVNDFTDIELPRRDTLLSPWLTAGSINMVFADRGVGKTFFCLSCAVALANGGSFLSYKAAKPVSVLYLDGEMQATAMQQRLSLLTKGNRTKAPLMVFTPDCQNLTNHIPDLGLPSGRNEVNGMIEAAQPKVVIIDNISTFIRSGNENEGDSWAPVQEWAVQLRKKDIAVVFVHHANKEGKQRGSHKKEDVMDIVLQIKRPDDFIQGQDDTRILIKYTKARHMGAQDTTELEATLSENGDELEWSWTVAEDPVQRALELLDSGMTHAEVASELGVAASTINRWKKRLRP